MKSFLAPLVLFVAAGCTPNNATITSGEYTAFLSYNTSRSLQKNNEDWTSQFEKDLIIDCRDLEDDVEPVEGSDSEEALAACRDFPNDHEQWLTFDAFHVVSGPLDPWRGEAVLTAEGDLQITFHNRLPDDQDFRFAFIVDPQFQPTECRQDENGDPVLRDVNNGDWVENWTNDVGGEGSMFYLNAGAYQFNPSNTDDVWIFPNEWSAGFGVAKFSEEDVYARSVRYGSPAAYAGYELDESGISGRDLFYAGLEEGTDPATDPSYQELIEEVAGGDSNVPEEKAECSELDATGISREVECEFANFGVEIDTRVHTNEWRLPDGSEAGLDGWVELHYNWVHFDQTREELAIGEAASGEFHLLLDAVESQSRVLVKGTFDVEKIRKDHAAVQDLTADKLEEYGTEFCGQPAPTSD